jgi:hypothetical protein
MSPYLYPTVKRTRRIELGTAVIPLGGENPLRLAGDLGTVDAGDKTLYHPPVDPVLIEVRESEFAMIDGSGDPNASPDYQAAVAALYAVSYPVVITLKKAGRPELKVRPLEGLWWADDLSVFQPASESREAWRWTMMIRQPEHVPGEVYEAAFAKMAKKLGQAAAERVRIERFKEGLSAQLMHRGPYASEGADIARLHEFAAAHGYRLYGRHHEIYLSDPRKSAPEKMRTVLRQPVRH